MAGLLCFKKMWKREPCCLTPICILVDSAANAHLSVSSLMITSVVLNNLSGLSVPVCGIFFSVSVQDHQHVRCVILFLHWSTWDILSILKKTVGAKNTTTIPFFYLRPTIGALLYLLHHLRHETKPIFNSPKLIFLI